ncbi:hypothetical protein EMIHUDRAFT_223664 [Emiliania huxleyi CCMP1516]|uniref:Ceramidase n=2 Tax=Emiliania huxleyi TaxID=2903 RepID=A0A0D3KTU9_EMIH1|nr:hypothetical protein EMIHUDRAFT_223664 [Emiliania huxleyi CCMP1516]EOD39184.1 hypothetical protein EMIHUDRAFT_223664 [Emiliania huxleyi CCMP1516]|eukprot:XP_005791613.1 hypothetical protein EMIHUDRAFT_223664 [Emiliania huxleyi CCMP1516]
MAPRNLFSTSLPRCDGAAPPPLLVLGMMVKPAEVRLRQVMRSLYQQGVPLFTDMAERVSLHFFCLRVVWEAHRRSGNETAEAMDSETNNARDIFLLDETLPGSLADAPETACIAQIVEWLRVATRLVPCTKFVGWMDDDMLVNLHRVAIFLREMQQVIPKNHEAVLGCMYHHPGFNLTARAFLPSGSTPWYVADTYERSAFVTLSTPFATRIVNAESTELFFKDYRDYMGAWAGRPRRGGCVGLDGDVTFGLLAHAARPAHVAYVTLGLQYEYYVWEVAGNFFPAYAVAVHSTFAKREYHRLSRQCRRSAPFGNAGRCEPELEGKTRTLRSSEFTKSDCAKVAALFGDRDRSIGQEGASQGWTNVSNFLRATLQNDTACSRTQRTVSNSPHTHGAGAIAFGVLSFGLTFLGVPSAAPGADSNSTIPTSKAGYWGEPTAVHQFCEPKYASSHYFAEYFNSLSSLVYAVVGCYMLWQREAIAVVVIGLGSCAFHGTMLFEHELCDEVPMLFFIGVAMAAKTDAPPEMNPRKRVAVGAAIGGLTLAYVLFQTYELFIGGFTALVVADSALALTWSSRQRVVSWCRDRSIALLIAGKIAWEIEVRMCASDGRVWPLHVAWHLLTAAALYYGVLSDTANRIDCGLSPAGSPATPCPLSACSH